MCNVNELKQEFSFRERFGNVLFISNYFKILSNFMYHITGLLLFVDTFVMPLSWNFWFVENFLQFYVSLYRIITFRGHFCYATLLEFLVCRKGPGWY